MTWQRSISSWSARARPVAPPPARFVSKGLLRGVAVPNVTKMMRGEPASAVGTMQKDVATAFSGSSPTALYSRTVETVSRVTTEGALALKIEPEVMTTANRRTGARLANASPAYVVRSPLRPGARLRCAT